MAKKKKSRKDLIEEINSAGREMSTVTIIFHQTIAEKAGLSGADHKYLDFLFREGAMTAGRLAELTGLTTGAVTGIIDRLEKKDLVKRESDPSDRRKVLVVPRIEKAMELLGPLFQSLQTELASIYDDFTVQDLEVIRMYLTNTIEYFERKTQSIRLEE